MKKYYEASITYHPENGGWIQIIDSALDDIVFEARELPSIIEQLRQIQQEIELTCSTDIENGETPSQQTNQNQ